MKTARSTFRLRLAIHTMLVAGVLMAAFGVGAWWYAQRQLARNLDLRVAEAARRLWTQLTPRYGAAEMREAATAIFGTATLNDGRTAVLVQSHVAGNPVIYSSAGEGQPDYGNAARWFTAAADHGLKDSQYNLAVLFERGLGVKQNMGEALFWYSLAARQADADATTKAAMLEQSLAPATLDAVKARIAAWTARAGDPAANIVAMEDPAWGAKAAVMADDVMTQSVDRAAQAEAVAASPVQRAQVLLAGLGYDIGAADGKMGARTANAIRLFELQSGMRVTGQVSEALIAKLAARKG